MFKAVNPFALHESLTEQRHRPWKIPEGPWVMQQTWERLLFAHWPIAASDLRPLIPEALDIDTFEGQAWIGVVPFYMSHVKPRLSPSVPGLSFFPELNVRTYVTYRGKPGVWFFSLEAANPIAVEIARKGFHLPYFNATMRCSEKKVVSKTNAQNRIVYYSQRTHKGAPAARFEGEYSPTGPVYFSQPGTLEHWLTERYALYSSKPHRDGSVSLYRGDIHHKPWPLQTAQAEIQVNTMTQPLGLHLPTQKPLLHYAHRIAVVVWPLVKL